MVAHPISASQGAGLAAETAVFLVAVFAVFYFTANIQPFQVGQDANFQFKIANYGEVTSTNKLIGLAVNGNSIGSFSIGNIPNGGNEYTFGFALTGIPEGTHEIKLTATPGIGLIDSNPSNNSISKNFIWKGIPDLFLSSFDTVSGSSSFKTDSDVDFENK